MIEIIVVSHGDYAKSMLESAQIIVGEQEHIRTFGLYLGESVDKLKEDISQAIEEMRQNGDILILTDMLYGSPFNAVVSLMQYYTFRHITGINLPILLEILMSRDSGNLSELCEEVMKKANDSILDVNKLFEVINK